ncbi:uncharacterized LOC729966 homolog [Prinia subflava]|uniref:uncharacterized LOC729966 homolog n=1 Tax=Prinia subflava TaxID=208062 RepID=UPI002FE2ACB1
MCEEVGEEPPLPALAVAVPCQTLSPRWGFTKTPLSGPPGLSPGHPARPGLRCSSPTPGFPGTAVAPPPCPPARGAPSRAAAPKGPAPCPCSFGGAAGGTSDPFQHRDRRRSRGAAGEPAVGERGDPGWLPGDPGLGAGPCRGWLPGTRCQAAAVWRRKRRRPGAVVLRPGFPTSQCPHIPRSLCARFPVYPRVPGDRGTPPAGPAHGPGWGEFWGSSGGGVLRVPAGSRRCGASRYRQGAPRAGAPPPPPGRIKAAGPAPGGMARGALRLLCCAVALLAAAASAPTPTSPSNPKTASTPSSAPASTGSSSSPSSTTTAPTSPSASGSTTHLTPSSSATTAPTPSSASGSTASSASPSNPNTTSTPHNTSASTPIPSSPSNTTTASTPPSTSGPTTHLTPSSNATTAAAPPHTRSTEHPPNSTSSPRPSGPAAPSSLTPTVSPNSSSTVTTSSRTAAGTGSTAGNSKQDPTEPSPGVVVAASLAVCLLVAGAAVLLVRRSQRGVPRFQHLDEVPMSKVMEGSSGPPTPS